MEGVLPIAIHMQQQCRFQGFEPRKIQLVKLRIFSYLIPCLHGCDFTVKRDVVRQLKETLYARSGYCPDRACDAVMADIGGPLMVEYGRAC